MELAVKPMRISSEFESPVLDVIKKRRSRRAYDQRLIESEKIRSLFEAARWAPSSMNDQPWKYIYATKDQPEFWNKIFQTLNDGNKAWVKDAPLLVVSLARKNFTLNNLPNVAAKYDLGGANAFLSLQATELGLNVHQMGGYHPQMLRENLNIPEAYEPGVIMAIGYPGDPNSLSENLKKRELAPRMRLVRDEFVMNKSF